MVLKISGVYIIIVIIIIIIMQFENNYYDIHDAQCLYVFKYFNTGI